MQLLKQRLPHRERILARKLKKRSRRPLQLTARGKYLRCPPDKARLRARLIVGKPAESALDLLRFTPGSSARLIYKVLHSAVHNAMNGKDQHDSSDLRVDKVLVDKGRFFKRHHPVSHGKAEAILKRSCHITVVLRSAAAA